MLKLSIPQMNNKVFFETTLEPPKSLVDEFAKENRDKKYYGSYD